MASMTGTRRSVIAAVVLAAVSAVFGVVMLASRPMSSAMPGMDMPASTPKPTSHGEMPGMDMPAEEHGPGEAPESDHNSGDMPGKELGAGDTAGTASDRPLVPVLGTFGGGSAAVLLTAGLMRRKDRAVNLAKRNARAERGAQK